MQINADQRAALVTKINASKLPESKLKRFLRSPYKNTVVKLCRKLGLNYGVKVKLAWGDQFKGIIPENVTARIWRYGQYEESTSSFIIQNLKPDSCFIDIGPHFGYFTLLSSRLVGPKGRVLAIEAMPDTYAILQSNIAINSLKNVTALEVAASNGSGTLVFKDFGILHSSLNTSAKPRGSVNKLEKEITVKSIAMDDVVAEQDFKRIDMIKIDAESSEELVLQGLTKTLTRDHPVVIIELGGHEVDEVEDGRVNYIFEYMAKFGYRGYLFDGSHLTEILQTQNLSYSNVIFKV